MFSISGSMLYNVAAGSVILKDSDMDSENLSLLIRLSVSDGRKTDSSKMVSFIGYNKRGLSAPTCKKCL